MASRIQIRRDTAANWTSANPALLAGELCYETDSGRMKIGTGANWSSTDYFVYEDTKLAELLDVTITGAAAGDFLRYNNSSSVWYNDAVNLATDTIGDYVASLVAGTGLTITDNSGEGSTPTIGVSASAYDAYGSAAAIQVSLLGEVESLYEAIDILTTTDIAEGTNLYFTNQRAIDATISSYDLVGSASVATISAVSQSNIYTDGRISDLTTTDIEEGTNRYFTNLRAINAASATYDAIGAASTAYTNAVAYADGLTTTDIAEGTSLYFTDERAQDAVGNSVGTGLTYTDGTGAIAVNTSVIQERVANVTDTEIGYLDGVTSAIQTQIDTKAPSASPTFTGVVTLPDNTVALGTKTTGDYVASLVAGTGVTLTNNSGETATPTVAIGQAVGTSASVTFANITATGTVTLAADPASALQAATKQYVDNIATGVHFHESVHAASITNLATIYNNGTSGVGATLTADTNRAFSVLDGESVTVGQRVLIKNQTDAKQNGIYTLTTNGSVSVPWVLTRATDADNNPTGELKTGDFCFIMGGTTNAGYGYINNSTANPIVIGTDNVTYTPFNAAQTLTNGSGINLVSNVLSVDTTTIQARVADVSDTEIGYLNGVTSAIQTQIDTKAPIASPTFTGTVTIPSGASISGFAPLESPTFTGTVTLPNNTVALGTQTTGNYMSDITAGTGLTVSHTAGEGSSASVSLNATLDNLSNVTAPAPADGNFLKYVSASSAWIPAAIPTINALDDIGDVVAPTPTDGHFLKYVSASSAWVPAAVPTINALDDIGDVSASAPVDRSPLIWSTSASAWVANSQDLTLGTPGTTDNVQISSYYGSIQMSSAAEGFVNITPSSITGTKPDYGPYFNLNVNNVTFSNGTDSFMIDPYWATNGQVLAFEPGFGSGGAFRPNSVVRDNLIRFYMEVM
jgi:hypothetical protein